MNRCEAKTKNAAERMRGILIIRDQIKRRKQEMFSQSD